MDKIRNPFSPGAGSPPPELVARAHARGIKVAATASPGTLIHTALSNVAASDGGFKLQPVEPGSYNSAAIILLTDGQRTTGPDPLDAAKMAAERGVRVYTVGVGTVEGEVIGFEGWSMRVRLDEESLKAVARETRGEYFHAGTAENLKQVYQSLSTKLTVEKKETEVAGLLALVASILALTAATLSLLWFNRIL